MKKELGKTYWYEYIKLLAILQKNKIEGKEKCKIIALLIKAFLRGYKAGFSEGYQFGRRTSN